MGLPQQERRRELIGEEGLLRAASGCRRRALPARKKTVCPASTTAVKSAYASSFQRAPREPPGEGGAHDTGSRRRTCL